jgi:hypothetical protein
MNMQTTHIQRHAAPHHHLQPGLDTTIDWFNRFLQGTPSTKKAREKAQQVLQMLQRLGPTIPTEQPKKQPSTKERSALERKINTQLKKYHYQFFVLAPPRPPSGWFTVTEYDDASAGLIAAVLGLGPYLASRIGFCDCGKAFYRRLERQQFCSENCRLAFYAGSEKWKKYRRDKAREYYWLRKAGIVKVNRK